VSGWRPGSASARVHWAAVVLVRDARRVARHGRRGEEAGQEWTVGGGEVRAQLEELDRALHEGLFDLGERGGHVERPRDGRACRGGRAVERARAERREEGGFGDGGACRVVEAGRSGPRVTGTPDGGEVVAFVPARRVRAVGEDERGEEREGERVRRVERAVIVPFPVEIGDRAEVGERPVDVVRRRPPPRTRRPASRPMPRRRCRRRVRARAPARGGAGRAVPPSRRRGDERFPRLSSWKDPEPTVPRRARDARRAGEPRAVVREPRASVARRNHAFERADAGRKGRPARSRFAARRAAAAGDGSSPVSNTCTMCPLTTPRNCAP